MARRRFQFQAVDSNGATVSDFVYAEDRGAALRQLTSTHKAVTDLREVGENDNANGLKLEFRPQVTMQERILVMRQLSVMSKAGVDLLEALEIIASSLPGRPIAAGLRDAAVSLRRGESLSKALERSIPGYPVYVYALVKAGESSGRLGIVLDEASRQLEYEERVRRDFVNALIYPIFLVCSGGLSIGFLFYVVVPKFSEMLSNANAHLSGLSAFVIGFGNFFHANALFVLAGLALTIFLGASLARTPSGQKFLSETGNAIPGLRLLIASRRRAAWARIMAIALQAGVGILEAAALAASCLPPSKQRDQSIFAIQALRSGKPIDEAFSRAGALAPLDASLVRAGQRSGALAEMFRAVADRNEETMRDAMKRITLLVEPIAIGMVAIIIGSIVLGLVSALASIYESIN